MTERELRTSLAETFVELSKRGTDTALVLEDDKGRFVQFLHEGAEVMLDLPLENLTYLQSLAAEELVVVQYAGSLFERGKRSAILQAYFPDDADTLAEVAIDVFRLVHEAVPRQALSVTFI